MKYLIIDTWTVTPHLETGLEIALRFASEDHSTWYCNISQLLVHHEGKSSRRVTRFGAYLGYQEPEIAAIKRAQSLARSKGWKLKFIAPKANLCDSPAVPKEYLENLHDLKCYCWENKYPGVSIASSIISAYGVEENNPLRHEREINVYFRDYIVSARVTQNLIRTLSPDTLVVFNGRFPSVAAIADVAKSNLINILYHERGASKEKYSLRPFSPHNRIEIQNEIIRLWESPLSLTTKRRTAEQFFMRQRNGDDIAWLSFTKSHVLGKATQLVYDSRSASLSGCVLTYFTSSSDEVESLSDNMYINSLFVDQKNALKQLIQLCLDLGHSVIVRNHPHMAIKGSADTSAWDQLAFVSTLPDHPRLQIIRSDDTISSYELMDQSDIIACYGSTIGVEALYWGKPVVQMGDGISIYDKLGTDLFVPITLESLRSWLAEGFRKQQLTTRTSEMYGYWALEHGFTYQFYKPKDLFCGSFLGINVQDQPTTRRHKAVDYLFKRLNLKKFPDIYNHTDRYAESC